MTLLIGVNDVVQGVAAERYRSNVEAILDDLVGRLPPDRLLVVTTPDYTVTPAGADYGDPATGVRRSPRTTRSWPSSRAGAGSRSSTSSTSPPGPRRIDRSSPRDGLHPSGAQYARWVDRIAPAVDRLLGRGHPASG